MDESKIDFNALGQVTDTTWGRSSTPKTASFSIKATLIDEDKLQITYQTIINFRDEKELLKVKRNYVDESIKISDESLKRIKQSYKELSGNSLKTKEVSSNDIIEIVGRRMAVYRRKTVVEIK